jgi:hypothetical protein
VAFVQAEVTRIINLNGVGNANTLNQLLASGNITGFISQVNQKCCLPANGKWFTQPQATYLIGLAGQI